MRRHRRAADGFTDGGQTDSRTCSSTESPTSCSAASSGGGFTYEQPDSLIDKQPDGPTVAQLDRVTNEQLDCFTGCDFTDAQPSNSPTSCPTDAINCTRNDNARRGLLALILEGVHS